MTIVRRSQVPRYAKYESYKPFLREDFQYRCAYCQHHERVFALLRSMTIDHFRPKILFPNLRVEYTNLYYCCGECNTFKADNWPTAEELAADLRFVDVCLDEWEEHIALDQHTMKGKTLAGQFTVEHLRLARPALTQRNRELKARIIRLQGDLKRIADIRNRSSGIVNRARLQDLNEIEDNLRSDLQELLSPPPLSH